MTVNHTDPAELLVVVDEHDNAVGAERRDVIHRLNLLHRAIHLFVFRPTGELLLQQRSALKDRYPLHWECIGGHVPPGQSYAQTALREAWEEAGVKLDMVSEIAKLPASLATDYEFITVFTAVTADGITSNPGEVIATQWLTPEEWRAEIEAEARRFSPTLLNTLRECAGVLG